MSVLILPRHWVLIAFSISNLCLSPSFLAANDPAFAELAKSLGDHCVDCHGGSEAEGNFDLSMLVERASATEMPVDDELTSWTKIYDRVAAGEMPPDEGLPSAQRDQFIRCCTTLWCVSTNNRSSETGVR